MYGVSCRRRAALRVASLLMVSVSAETSFAEPSVIDDASLACPLLAPPEARRPLIIGALGTSLTWGADLPDPVLQAWPAVLQRELSHRLGRRDIFLLNGAMRATSADFAALCFDELWGSAWRDSRGLARPPRLDLAIIEYNWSSSPSQISALIEVITPELHPNLIPSPLPSSSPSPCPHPHPHPHPHPNPNPNPTLRRCTRAACRA